MCIRDRLYTVHRSTQTVRVALWERLVLPTTTRDGRRFIIAFSRPLQFREDLLNAVLDSSPCGIVAPVSYTHLDVYKRQP